MTDETLEFNRNPILRSRMCNGLRQSTPCDIAILKQCMGKATSLNSLWVDNDDVAKIIEWDSDWTHYLNNRAKLIERDGHERYLPWNAYKELKLNWVNGYNFSQNAGDCVSMGHKNSLKTSKPNKLSSHR